MNIKLKSTLSDAFFEILFSACKKTQNSLKYLNALRNSVGIQ